MNSEAQKCILVVDDEADVREYLRMALEDAGFTVKTASNGLEALDIVTRSLPDLISLDLVMPLHSGVKFYRDLQKDKCFSKIPVLIVTGHARDAMGRADFEEMTMSGPGIYLEKPVHPDTYVSAVRQLLGIEGPQPTQQPGDLRNQLEKALSGADHDALQRALDALKNK